MFPNSKKQKQQKQQASPWSQKSLSISNPFPRYGHSINQGGLNDTNDQVYIFGGIVNGHVTNDIYMVETNTLNICGLMTTGDTPPPRSFHTQVNVGINMIVFGGLPLNPIEKPDNSIYILNTEKSQWYKPATKGNPNVGRFGHSAAMIGLKMYIFGGQQSGGYFLNDLIVFDLQTLFNYGVVQWEFITPSNEPPVRRSGQTACAFQDKIYIFGGTDGNKCYNDTWYYDTQTNTWNELSCIGHIPSPRKNHGATIIDDIIYVFGGKGQDGLEIGDLVAFKIANQRWYIFSEMGTAPCPRHGLVMTSSYGKAFVFGGDCSRSPKPDEDGVINVLDTTRIKYPTSPRVRSNTIDRNNSTSPSIPINEPNASYYNKSYNNIKSPTKQISPSGSQSSLNSLYSPMGPQGSPRNQASPKRPPNNSSTSSSYNNDLGEAPEISRPLSPQPGQKQEIIHKQSQGGSQMTNLPMHMAGTIGDFQHPRRAPHPPIQHGNNTISSPTSSSQNSLKSPTFDAIDQFPTPISNMERDNFLRELQNRDVQITKSKNRETWLKTELALARQAGYVFEEDHKTPEGIDLENFMDIGEAGSDRNKIMLAVVKIKQELRRAKATIANQAQVASQKITDAERTRTAAIQEAVYFKAKLNALLDASESELAKIEIERATDLEKRLTQALTEKESLQNKIHQLQQTSNYDKNSRIVAETREKSATKRAEEAEDAHARALAELATLHSRTTTAESQLRENNIRLAEANAELSQYRSGSDNSRTQIEQLQQSLEKYKRTMEKVNVAVVAANERANEAESLWKQGRQDIISLEKEAAGLRAELDIKMRDLDRTHARANEMERLNVKAQKEVDAVRAMMQEGMTELLNTSRSNNDGSNSSEAAKKIKVLEKEVSNLKSINTNSQKASQETSNSLADAMVKISQMEGAAMKARSDSAMLQRKLVEASDENARTKDKLREKELLLAERTRALEDAEVQVGMMRDVMAEKGILDNTSNDNKGGILSNRFKELESKYDELENEHNQIMRKAKDAEEKAKILEIELERANSAGSKSITPDIDDDLKIRDLNEKLHKAQADYQRVIQYVKSTEVMLRKMKDELTKNKEEKELLNEKYSAAQKRNEELEEKLSKVENNSSARNELHDSRLQESNNRRLLEEQRSEFIKEKGNLQQRINNLQSELDHAYREKNSLDAEYEMLRKEYEILRKENDSLQSIDQELRESLRDSEKAIQGTHDELEELYSNVNKEFSSMTLGSKGSINNQERKNWDGPRVMLEQQISEYRVTNEKLAKENSDLEQKWRESENKIALLLDQMETAVGNYREIEDDIRDSSPRDSNVITSLNNEINMLRSQYTSNQDASNQDIELSDDEFIDVNWSKQPNNNINKNNDQASRIIAALAQRNIGNVGSDNNEPRNMGSNTESNTSNMFNKDGNNSRVSPRNFNNSTKGPTRMIDQIRGQLSLTPPPTPPASHQV